MTIASRLWLGLAPALLPSFCLSLLLGHSVGLDACTANGQEPKANRPNVVVILTDDQGWGDLSLHGNPNLSTPNIDALAKQGAHLRHFYVCAVCSPTRAEFLTGRYHGRMGVYSTSTGGERIDADEQLIAEVFRQAGYATAAYGKWHSGMQYPYHPNARGFQDYYGFCSGHWGNYFSPMLEHNGQLVTGEGFLVDDLTNHAMDFIETHQDEPFFVYLPLNTPHSPMQVPDPYWDRFKDKSIVADPAPANAKRQDLVHTRAALAMCENIDDNVGRLTSHLAKLGLEEDTILVYFSDNGPNGSRWNAGLHGRKGSVYEGGLRSPCLIRYPRQIEGGTQIDRIVAAIDLLPTLAELADIEFTPHKPLDGRSVAPMLRGGSLAWEDRRLFSAWRNRHSLRSERFRKHAGGALYDIKADPGETRDVAARFPDIAASMEAELQRYINEISDTAQNTDRPFTLAHPDATYTQLPARDAEPHGGIVRSNKFPNCTYMTNWTSPQDAITWDVEVLDEGRYEVTMYYACEADSVGSVLELSLGEQRLEKTISEANDVPRIGMEHDRFPRAEGYVKDWKPMTLGTLTLAPGRKTLTLRASKVTGKDVAEMRLLMFRRL